MNTYFYNVNSLGELKRQYRKLAIENHPDKGGDTEVMAKINAEFDRLFEFWKNNKAVSNTGYDSDFADAKTSKEYTKYVWNEYAWVGSRYKGYRPTKDLAKEFREWVKKAYPNCKFSITSRGYKSINVSLVQADFQAFIDPERKSAFFNHYWPDNRFKTFTPRCVEVLKNISDYIQSFNYDNSDVMTDYFDTGFYLNINVGSYSKNFNYVPIQLKSKEKTFKRKVGPVEKSVKAAMGAGNIFWPERVWRNGEEIETDRMALSKDDDCHYSLGISQPSIRKARIQKLKDVGIIAHAEGYEIILDYYTDELTAKLKAEKDAEDLREKEFYANQK